MIKINLLPVERKKPVQIYTQLIIAGAIIAVTLFGVAYAWIGLNKTIESKREEISIKEKRVKELEAIIQEVKEFEKKRDLLRQKLEIIENLRRWQKAPVKFLMAILDVIPDQVWLSTLENVGGNIRVTGYGLSLTQVGKFLSNLQANELFSNDQLISSIKQNVGGQDVYNFTITFQINAEKF